MNMTFFKDHFLFHKIKKYDKNKKILSFEVLFAIVEQIL